jgi:hypothetical protein
MVILENQAATNKQTFNNNNNMTTTKKACHVKKKAPFATQNRACKAVLWIRIRNLDHDRHPGPADQEPIKKNYTFSRNFKMRSKILKVMPPL